MSVAIQNGTIKVRLNEQLVVDAKIAEYGALKDMPASGYFGLFNFGGLAKGSKFPTSGSANCRMSHAMPRRFSSLTTACTIVDTSSGLAPLVSVEMEQPQTGSSVKPCSASMHCSVSANFTSSAC